MSDVTVVGCGLIGASVGLALTLAGRDVCVHDRSAAVVSEAVGLGAGRAWDGSEQADLVVVAVPPRATAAALISAQRAGLGRTLTHVASVQSQVQREVEALGGDLSRIVGGHPLAGRETSGPGAATPDLFVGRPWALCPSDRTADDAVAQVSELVADCGADLVLIGAAEHDASVALLSHLPQLAASALAACLTLPADGVVTRLAGPGLVDTTRIAASSPDLWAEILEMNAAQVAPLARRLGDRLIEVASALDQLSETGKGSLVDASTDAAAADAVPDAAPDAAPDATAHGTTDRRGVAAASVRSVLVDGNTGRALVPVKRGVVSEAFAPVRVRVRDEPGRLAALLLDAGAAEVNVEDVRVEHVPGRPSGVIELTVRREDVERLAPALTARGWTLLASG